MAAKVPPLSVRAAGVRLSGAVPRLASAETAKVPAVTVVLPA